MCPPRTQTPVYVWGLMQVEKKVSLSLSLSLSLSFSLHTHKTTCHYNGEFGKFPSHQMAVAIMYLMGKKLEKFILDIVHYHTFYVDTNIFSVFNEPFQSFHCMW